jgi:hypothetical protein
MKMGCAILVLLACALVALLGYLDWHGYFDRGTFEIGQTAWSPSNRLAVVVTRSDQQAMSSYTTFVLITDHLPTTAEIRHAYHSDAPVFAAANPCLTVSWAGPDRLVIACRGALVTSDQIDVERSQIDGIQVHYEGIPAK